MNERTEKINKIKENKYKKNRITGQEHSMYDQRQELAKAIIGLN